MFVRMEDDNQRCLGVLLSKDIIDKKYRQERRKVIKLLVLN